MEFCVGLLDHVFEVHKIGCRDIPKKAIDWWQRIEASTPEAAGEVALDGEFGSIDAKENATMREAGLTARVMNCAKHGVR